MGMLLSENPSALSAAEILQELPKAEGLRWDHLSLAIFLVTPKFAHLLHQDSSFLASAMTSIFGSQQPDMTTLTSIVGIVDKLAGEMGANRIPVAREGIGYILARPGDIGTESNDAAGDDASPSMVWLQHRRGKAGVPWDNKVQCLAGVEGHSRIGMPMANTLFVNGRKTTLEEISWVKGDDGILRRQKSLQLSGLSIGLPHSLTYTQSLLPLKPLAPNLETINYRVVTSALGNVLRTVEVDGTETPASKELEESIAKCPLPAGPDGSLAKVYAAVTPKDRPELSNFRPWPWNLSSGKSIFRVTGGGGGWGQKQGLLSLDPRRSYGAVDETHSRSKFTDALFDDIPDFLGPGKSLVQPGDRVAFFTEGDAKVKEKDTRFKWPPTSREDQCMLLGVAKGLEKNDTDSYSGHETPVDHLRDLFGILTEQGLAFEFDGTFYPPLEEFVDVFTRVGDGSRFYEKQPWNKARSKTGQPFSHKTLVELAGAWVGSICWNSAHEQNALEVDRKRERQLQRTRAAATNSAGIRQSAAQQQLQDTGTADTVPASLQEAMAKRRQARTAQAQQDMRPAADRVVFHMDVPEPYEAIEEGGVEDRAGGWVSLDETRPQVPDEAATPTTTPHRKGTSGGEENSDGKPER